MDVELLATDRAVHEIRLTADQELLVRVQRPANSSYSAVELLSHDGLAPIYFCWSSTASVAGSDCDVFPAVVGTLSMTVPGYGSGAASVDLHLISAGAPLISLTRR